MQQTDCVLNGLNQVSTSSVVEGKELPTRSSSETTKVAVSLDSSSHRIIAVHYVLEESSGYMEPTLRILAILHTVISFFCIIGYYCLKVSPYIRSRANTTMGLDYEHMIKREHTREG
jgi:hypothetical protein